MQYHWGLAIGHWYTHNSTSRSMSQNYDGTNLHHAPIDKDSDNKSDMEEQLGVIASSSKERQVRTSNVPGDSGHSQACALEQAIPKQIMFSKWVQILGGRLEF
jgi:hypothetical protein